MIENKKNFRTRKANLLERLSIFMLTSNHKCPNDNSKLNNTYIIVKRGQKLREDIPDSPYITTETTELKCLICNYKENVPIGIEYLSDENGNKILKTSDLWKIYRT